LERFLCTRDLSIPFKLINYFCEFERDENPKSSLEKNYAGGRTWRRNMKKEWTFINSARAMFSVVCIFIFIMALMGAFGYVIKGVFFPWWIPVLIFFTSPLLIFFRIHLKGGLHLPDWEEKEKNGEVMQNIWTGSISSTRIRYYKCRRCGRVAGKDII